MSLRDAAQQALEALETLAHTKGPSVYNSARDVLRAALAEPQPQPEPVASMEGVDEYGPMLNWHKHWTSVPIGTRFYTHPPQRQPLYVCSRSDCPTRITCGGAT